MTFEELSTKNEAQLPLDHPAHYLENVIKRDVLSKKDKHDQEHEDMLKHWGHENLKANQLTFRFDSEGNPYTDRFWHIALHLLYWKQKGMHEDHVKEFESRFYKLEETPLPEIKKVNNLPEY